MKRIVEKYSEVTMTLDEAIDLGEQAVYYDREEATDIDTKTYFREVAESIRKFKNKDEILLSEVKEGSIVCVLHRDKARVVSSYTDNRSVSVYITDSRAALASRTFIDKWVKNSNIICYVVKDYREALKWLVKEDSKENNDILITED